MENQSLEARFQTISENSGAIQEGHFKLASGLHSSRFFRCIKLFQDPTESEFLFDALAARFSTPINYVLGANEAGSIIAFQIAKRLKTKAAIARQTDHHYHLIDGFQFQPNSQVLVVDDITTTGGTAKQLIQIIRQAGANPVGVGLIATKGLFKVDLSCPVEVLMTLENMDAIPPEDCPLCQRGVPLTT